MSRLKIDFTFLMLCFLFSMKLMAWGERGHHVICEVATRLVENEELAQFLRGRGHQSGHVCNIPDIQWKDIPVANALLDSSHYMNPETLGYTIGDVPLDLEQIATAKSKTKEQVALELGSLWWRADQFYQRAVEGVRLAKWAEFPDKNHLKDIAHPYNQGIFEFIVNVSLLGHYVGDASMPYHNTIDYDGWEKGRGGIHAYYESFSVEAMGLDLENLIYEQSIVLKKKSGSLKVNLNQTVLEKLKELSIKAVEEKIKVEELDPLLTASDKVSKTYAKRLPPEKGAELFKDLILGQMARSSFALSVLWEKAWTEGGAVSFKGYRSYRYPLAPELVLPNYLKK